MSNRLQKLFETKMTRKGFIKGSFLLFVSSFAIYGVIEQLLSNAATPSGSTEADSGSKTGAATVVANTATPDDKAIEFGKPVTTSTSTTSNNLFVGVSMGADDSLFFDSDNGLAQYKIIDADGFKSVRLDCAYTTSSTCYYDASIRAALAAGLDVLLILDQYNAGTTSAAQFASFAANMVATYKPLGIKHYEIMNEINGNGNWNSNNTVNPAAYAALCKETYSAIKSADADAIVISSGLAVFSQNDGADQGDGNYSSSLLPGTFLTLMYAAMGGDSTGYFDAVGAHPYAGGAPTTGNNWGVFMNPPGTAGYYGDSVRTIMVNNGDTDKKIWITEYGIETDGSDDSSYTTQASDYTTTFDLINSYDYVGAFYCFNWNDDGDGDWGLNNSSYSAKPALATVMANIQTLNANA
jgi:hypothetical protein